MEDGVALMDFEPHGNPNGSDDENVDIEQVLMMPLRPNYDIWYISPNENTENEIPAVPDFVLPDCLRPRASTYPFRNRARSNPRRNGRTK